MFGGHIISLVVEKYGKGNRNIIMSGTTFSRKNMCSPMIRLVPCVVVDTQIADLQISKSPIGPTKKSGEAL